MKTFLASALLTLLIASAATAQDHPYLQDNQVDVATVATDTSAQLSFINELSLDQVLVLNYYF